MLETAASCRKEAERVRAEAVAETSSLLVRQHLEGIAANYEMLARLLDTTYGPAPSSLGPLLGNIMGSRNPPACVFDTIAQATIAVAPVPWPNDVTEIDSGYVIVDTAIVYSVPRGVRRLTIVINAVNDRRATFQSGTAARD